MIQKKFKNKIYNKKELENKIKEYFKRLISKYLRIAFYSRKLVAMHIFNT